jgi:biopolymer transport protein ExbB/TolQ
LTDEQPGQAISEALSTTVAGLRIALEQWDKEARELREQVEKLKAMNRELETQLKNREIVAQWESRRQQ